MPWTFPAAFIVGLAIELAIAWHRRRADARTREAQRRAAYHHHRTGSGR